MSYVYMLGAAVTAYFVFYFIGKRCKRNKNAAFKPADNSDLNKLLKEAIDGVPSAKCQDEICAGACQSETKTVPVEQKTTAEAEMAIFAGELSVDFFPNVHPDKILSALKEGYTFSKKSKRWYKGGGFAKNPLV